MPELETKSRRTNADYEKASAFIIAYAKLHGPVSVRQLYYAAGMANVPGIGKDEKHCRKIQEQVLALRRNGELDYDLIVDRSRNPVGWPGYTGVDQAVYSLSYNYVLDYWIDQPVVVEVLLDKDALLGVVEPVTNSEYHVRLQPYRGSASESFAWEMIEYHRKRDEQRPIHFLHLGDLDLYGFDNRNALERKLRDFAAAAGLTIEFHHIGLTWAQALPRLASALRPQKWPTNAAALAKAKARWPHDQAMELDAMPPDELRDLLRTELARYMPAKLLKAKRAEEEGHRNELRRLADEYERS